MQQPLRMGDQGPIWKGERPKAQSRWKLVATAGGDTLSCVKFAPQRL